MRGVWVFLALLMTAMSRSADILILIPWEDAGPPVHSPGYKHPIWVLWPAAEGTGLNRLMTLPSGIAWKEGPTTPDYLQKIGFFRAMDAHLKKRVPVAVRGEDGELDPYTDAATGFSSSIRRVADRPTHLNSDEFAVATVRGIRAWDRKAKLVESSGGRAMVVEVPSLPGQMWSRLWLEGRGWPDGVPVVKKTGFPGIVDAASLTDLLERPEEARWVVWDGDRQSTPNAWLEFGHETAPMILVFLSVGVLYVIGASIYNILREVQSRVALGLLRLVILGPAAVVLSGLPMSRGPIQSWPFWFFISWLGLLLTSLLLGWLAKKLFPDRHPLWTDCLVGLFTVAMASPAFTFVSPILGPRPVPFSPEQAGSLAAYAVGAFHLAPRYKGSEWVMGFVVLAALSAYPLLNHIEGREFRALTIAAILLASGHRAILTGVLAISMIWAIAFDHIPRWTYANNDLFRSLESSRYINLYDYASFAASPTFIGFVTLIAVGVIVGDRFLRRQFRRALNFSPFPKAFGWASLGFLVVGLVAPIYLYAALITAMAGCLVVLFDAIRTP
ncbi:MAG: hypothetical protein IT203_07390 [Fimbriimonadaceae bacterium]|nr:hypothetical protein [Fimbriimonadaceae bacterium]